MSSALTEAPLSLSAFAPAIPEIYVGIALCVVLLVEAFCGERRRGLADTLTLIVLVAGIGVSALWAPVNAHATLFHGLYVADPLGSALKIAGFLIVAFTLIYSRAYLDQRDILRGEYNVLCLTALLGIFVLISANNLITVYVGVELLALSVYALVAFDRESGIAAEAAMKYFVLSAIASGTLLYGMSIIYGMTGSLDLDVIAGSIRAGNASLGVILGLVFIVAAVAFKLGAVPFHMWLPDVYQGAPTSVTLFISTVPQLAYFSLAFRLLAHGLAGATAEWTQMLMPLAVLTLIVGNFVAIAQSNLKRMLAYSTIANVGFILLGFITGTPQGYSAALYYTLVYILVVLGSFGVILLASRHGFEAEALDDYKGLWERDPFLAIVLMALMFSTAGVPPFIGFWAKLRIIQELWATQHATLVIIAAATSVVGAFYYLRIVKLMYFDAPVGELSRPARNPGGRAALALNAAAVLILGVMPAPLLDLCARILH
jgi:NADH-quinone oxidoreductase subunit N